MRIVLSRKGFDSGYGGYPSPIMPDGTLLSIPIPDNFSDVKYNSLTYCDNVTYYDILCQLVGEKIRLEGVGSVELKNIGCHFDPDVRCNSLKRDPNWTGIFGQVGAAQTHLMNQGIKENDIFLFFGWFKNTIYKNGKLQFDPKDKTGKHIIYGYMQISETHKIINTKFKKWMLYHPHIKREHSDKSNDTIYIAREALTWNNLKKGYGNFRFNEKLVLTQDGMSKSKWKLPKIFKNASISYHNQANWKNDYFQSAAKGQEFVIQPNEKIISWAKNLIETCI